MKREWKPGDVALIDGNPALFVNTGEISGEPAFIVASGDEHRVPNDTARPLVVIDPEDREQVERLNSLFWSPDLLGRSNPDRLQAALREFANPTPLKPAEPMGLGAVVEDADGATWVRYSDELGSFWTSRHGVTLSWRQMNAGKVLSEGVTQ